MEEKLNRAIDLLTEFRGFCDPVANQADVESIDLVLELLKKEVNRS